MLTESYSSLEIKLFPHSFQLYPSFFCMQWLLSIWNKGMCLLRALYLSKIQKFCTWGKSCCKLVIYSSLFSFLLQQLSMTIWMCLACDKKMAVILYYGLGGEVLARNWKMWIFSLALSSEERWCWACTLDFRRNRAVKETGSECTGLESGLTELCLSSVPIDAFQK